MSSKPQQYERVSNVAGLVWLLLLTLPFVIWGGMGALSNFSNDIRQWLPKGFVEAERYDWFTQHFGVDEMIVVGWEGCTFRDSRLPQLAAALRDERDGSGRAVFSRVITGPEILEQIINRLNVSEEEAFLRCRGVFIGPDGETTCLLAFPSAEASVNRTKVVQRLLAVTERSIGLDDAATKLGGPTVDGATIDRESKRSLQTYIGLTAIVVMGLTWWRLRNSLLTTVILGVAAYCGVMSLSLLYWTGQPMNLTMIMLPTLSFILAVSGCVHMTNYFIKAHYVHRAADPVSESIRYGAGPVFLSSLTTALGLGSLATSQIIPIKMFGLYSAVAVLLSLPLIVYVVPTMLKLISNYRRLIVNKDELLDEGEVPMGWFVRSCAALSRRTPIITVATFSLALGLIGWGCFWLQSTVKLQGRFAQSTKIIQDYTWLETHLGPLVPMEVILRIPADHPLSEFDRMRMVASLDAAIKTNPDINASFSAATFRPEIARGRGLKQEIAERLMRESWQGHLPEIEKAGLVRLADGEQLWRISLRINALNQIDYGYLLDAIRVSVDEHLGKMNGRLHETGQPGNLSVVLTGGVPMIYRAQHQVLSDLMISFVSAFMTISLVMMWVARGIMAGLVAMLPNIFPPLIVFGVMGWTGWLIDIGSVMTASVAMGIAVDDTIHFLAWYRRGIDKGLTKYGAVEFSFHHCGKSMVDSTLICGLGVAPFLFSEFLPTFRFSLLMLLMLLVGLVGDLVYLPTLLLSPIGRFFHRHKSIGADGRSGKNGESNQIAA